MESENLHSFAKRRGFYWPSYELYGGMAGFYDYGPLGAALLENITAHWRRLYIIQEGMMEIDSPSIAMEDVFKASGHLREFTDHLTTCQECGDGYRADHLLEGLEAAPDALDTDALSAALEKHGVVCPKCKGHLSPPEPFNLMFGTRVGPGSGRTGYLRPETAQAMFVAFVNLAQQARKKLPFGVVQIGRGYRNEISPRQGLLRQREFHMAEAEVFFHPDEKRWEGDPELLDTALRLVDQREEEHRMTANEAAEEGVVSGKALAYFMALTQRFLEDVGVDPERLRFRQHLKEEMAHYASDCWDAEALLSYGWTELVGVADRGDYDLNQHIRYSGQELGIFVPYDNPKEEERAMLVPDLKKLGPLFRSNAGAVASAIEASPLTEGELVVQVDGENITIPPDCYTEENKKVKLTGENVVPHVIEPSYGMDRIFYAVLEHNLDIGEKGGEEYRVLRLPPNMAPVQVGVFPLMSKEELEPMAREVSLLLRKNGWRTTYDSSGSIGRRYARADEAGTPWCITIDYESVENRDVTVRDRDTAKQERVPIEELLSHLSSLAIG